MPERILFVCYGNTHRSPTAARLYERDPRYEIRSAGMIDWGWMNRLGLFRGKRTLTAEDISWAQRIFVMGTDVLDSMRMEARYRSVDTSSFINLGIPDEFNTRNNGARQRLKRILLERLQPYLGEPVSS